MTDCTPASAAHAKAGLIAGPQLETEFSGQLPVSSQKLWVEFIRAEPRVDGQLHKAPYFGDVERFKASGGHVSVSNEVKLCRLN
jgi:hypothetical protein